MRHTGHSETVGEKCYELQPERPRCTSCRVQGSPCCWRILDNVAAMIQLCAERARQRRALANLDEHLLRDIGLNRAEVAGEVRKHFWQI